MKKIAHLALDEKFVDSAIRDYDRCDECENDLFIFSRKKISLIKSRITYQASLLDLLFSNKLMATLKQYDAVVIHSLSPFWSKFILRLSCEIKVHWIGWGFDYYDLIEAKNLTLSAVKSRKGYFKKRSKKIISKLLFRTSKHEVIERIDFFSPVLKSEYFTLKKIKNWSSFPEFIEWNYGNLEEDLLKNLIDKEIIGNNILVGNSATKTNNHIEAFKYLIGKLQIEQKVITPLSYGDRDYGDLVVKKGRDSFGDNFIPLRIFMAIEEYLEILLSCKFVVMNHVRQQGYGNIIIMLFLGAKVYLRKENPIYETLINLGIEVYTIDQLQIDESISEQKESIDVKSNREILGKQWSKEVSLERTRMAVKTLLKEKG